MTKSGNLIRDLDTSKNNDILHIYNYSTVTQNGKKLDTLYDNSLEFDELDERCFLSERATFTPSKFITPYTKFTTQDDTMSGEKCFALNKITGSSDKPNFSSKLRDLVIIYIYIFFTQIKKFNDSSFSSIEPIENPVHCVRWEQVLFK